MNNRGTHSTESTANKDLLAIWKIMYFLKCLAIVTRKYLTTNIFLYFPIMIINLLKFPRRLSWLTILHRLHYYLCQVWQMLMHHHRQVKVIGIAWQRLGWFSVGLYHYHNSKCDKAVMGGDLFANQRWFYKWRRHRCRSWWCQFIPQHG